MHITLIMEKLSSFQVPQIVGIAFNLIIARVATHSEEQSTYGSVSARSMSFAVEMQHPNRSTTFAHSSTTEAVSHKDHHSDHRLEPKKDVGWDNAV
jgi:hypothetical protein